jgi:hypothetical protein
MATKSTGNVVIDALYAARKGRVDFVDVPELGFVVVDGRGEPGGDAFSLALQALYTVSYGAHFAVKKATGSAPRVMPLEALWWVEGVGAQAAMEALATGQTSLADADRDRWRWRAMIAQLPPVDEVVVERAAADARAKKDLATLDDVRFERWTEGACAQTMHVGSYAVEGPTIVALHAAIADRGARPRGRHHEIYLGDPRTSAPERLRTILRQPVEGLG